MGTDHAAGILAKQKRKTRNGNMSFISTLNLPKITNSKKKVHFLCMTYTIFYLVVAFNIIIQIFVRDYLGLIFLSLSILHFKLISEYAMNVTGWGGGGGGGWDCHSGVLVHGKRNTLLRFLFTTNSGL